MTINQYYELQSLHAVNSQQLYAAWREARLRAQHYRYGLVWKASKGKEYLFRLRDRNGNGRSLGLRSEQMESAYADFYSGKERALSTLKTIDEVMAQQARLNKAVNINRLPSIAGKILRSFDLARLTEQFKVVGTNSLYAYEAYAGVLFPAQSLATGDIDLMYDRRSKLSIAGQKLDKGGLLGLLKTTDKTFRISDTSYTAVNAEGFMVDLITTDQDMRHHDIITFGDDDLVASEVPDLQWLLNSPRFNAIAIDHSGMPASMNVPDPRAFALHKIWLSRQKTRNPVKALRDKAQAQLVAQVVSGYMPALSFNETLTAVHRDLRDLLPELGVDVNAPDAAESVERFLSGRRIGARPS